MRTTRLRRLIQSLAYFISLFLLIFTLLISCLFPTFAQSFTNSELPENTLISDNNTPMFRRGNLNVSPVFLSGKMLGTIPSFVELRTDNDILESIYDASTRSYILHSKLVNVLENMLRYTREIVPQNIGLEQQEKILEEQLITSVDEQKGITVVLVSFPKENLPEVLFSVTQADIERPRLGGSQPFQIADNVATRAKSDLIQAWKERQTPHLLSQAQQALLILTALIGANFCLSRGQKWLFAKQNNLDEFFLNSEDKASQDQIVDKLKSWRGMEVTELQFQNFSMSPKSNLNALYRSVLFWTQWLVWLLGIGYLCSLFYWSRPFSNWILGVTIRGTWAGSVVPSWAPIDWLISLGRQATLGTPLLMLVLVLTSRLAIKIGDVLCEYLAQKSSERQLQQRLTIRSRTLSKMFKDWLRTIIYLLLGSAIVYHLHELGSINQSVAFFFGFFGFAISLASQSLLKDLIAGVIILWEDQYAVGDTVKIGDQNGSVEKISLRATQLRNLNGELITIPNGSIGVVQNLSSDWSQVNYAIEVSYEADVDHTLEVIDNVAQQLYSDPAWHEKIIKKPEILGIDKIAHTGILIRLLIRTRPLEQWSVEREYSRRLKKAFDENNIEIGIPKLQLKSNSNP